MTGSGNDFVLIDNRDKGYAVEWDALAPKICDRRYGVGADGILVLEKSPAADIRMSYFNADGSYGGMCGNGGRCVASYLMAPSGNSILTIEALDYIYRAAGNSARVTLFMKDPAGIQTGVELRLRAGTISAQFVNTGSPHVVIFRDELPEQLKETLEKDGIERFGREIRQHPRFAPDGANVNFVTSIDASRIAVRTYERGVEGETMACGTGAVASAIMASLLRENVSPVFVIPRSGDALTVSFAKSGEAFSNVALEGAVQRVFTGEYSWIREKRA
jgi:diaminopimelate epimerase